MTLGAFHRRRFFAALAFMLVTLPLMVASAALPRVFGQPITLRTLPLDPWDPMRGQYMDVRLDLGALDCATIRCSTSARAYAHADYTPPRNSRLLVVLGKQGSAHTAIALVTTPEEVHGVARDAPYIALNEWSAAPGDGGNPKFTASLVVPFFFEEGTQARYQAANANQEVVLHAHVWRGTLRSHDLVVREKTAAPAAPSGDTTM